jgi:hypothetical protein
MRKWIYCFCFLSGYLLTVSFYPSMNPVGRRSWLVIQFDNYVGNEELKLDKTKYKNELGQSYFVTKFKYYISDIRIKDISGYEYYITQSYLLNEDADSSRIIVLKEVPYGNFVSLSFIIGVDSVHSVNGAQSGDLDPVNGMYWTWNNGYVFMKLEGISPASKSPGNIFEYHIGRYQFPNNFIRPITIHFKKDELMLVAKLDTYLTIKTDVSEILKTPNVIDFSKLSSVTDFHNAAMIADNYTDMFSVLNILQDVYRY